MSTMANAQMRTHRSTSSERRMQLRYGVTEADNWWDFALGPERERIWARLREIDTRIIGIFLFDKGAPDPLTEWEVFAAYVQAVLNVGATPMITFATFPRTFDNHRALRSFAGRCTDVVWSCIEQWGGEVVRNWYWCVGNAPNSDWISGGLPFEQYRHIYEEVAQGILHWLAPYLGGRRPLIGGPGVDGFQPFWIDWVWRFVNEIDNSLIGFAAWHQYGDWREHGAWGAPCDEAIYQALLMSRTTEYESRARAVARIVKGREILNVCSELNAHSHHEVHVSQRFNQTIFGATYYASALFHLIRGGADIETFRTGTDDTGPYGVMDQAAAITPVFYAKKLCAQHIRYGDRLSFPPSSQAKPGVNVVVACGANARQSAFLVHVKDEVATYTVSEFIGSPEGYHTLLKIDCGTGNRVAQLRFDGTVIFDGYGVAVVTSESSYE